MEKATPTRRGRRVSIAAVGGGRRTTGRGPTKALRPRAQAPPTRVWRPAKRSTDPLTGRSRAVAVRHPLREDAVRRSPRSAAGQGFAGGSNMADDIARLFRRSIHGASRPGGRAAFSSRSAAYRFSSAVRRTAPPPVAPVLFTIYRRPEFFLSTYLFLRVQQRISYDRLAVILLHSRSANVFVYHTKMTLWFPDAAAAASVGRTRVTPYTYTKCILSALINRPVYLQYT